MLPLLLVLATASAKIIINKNPVLLMPNDNITLNSDSGVVYSYNYPSNYDNADNYYITITVDPGNYILLTLLDFVTEACCDRLTVYDGADSTAAATEYSGVQTSKYVFSSSNVLTLHFISDLTVNMRGFALEWQETTNNQRIELTNSCPQVITSSQGGFVTSPNWPLNYPNNISCPYKLVSSKSRVKLTFAAFATESCCDKVFIYDGESAAAPMIATLSGVNPPNNTFVSSGPSMFLYFSTDLTTNDSGFSAFFVST